MADRVAAGQFFKNRVPFEAVGHQPHTFIGVQPLPIAGDNATTLLTAMLQSIKTEVGQVGGLRVAEDTEDTAFIMELVRHDLKISAAGDQRCLLLLVLPGTASQEPRPWS